CLKSCIEFAHQEVMIDDHFVRLQIKKSRLLFPDVIFESLDQLIVLFSFAIVSWLVSKTFLKLVNSIVTLVTSILFSAIDLFKVIFTAPLQSIFKGRKLKI